MNTTMRSSTLVTDPELLQKVHVWGGQCCINSQEAVMQMICRKGCSGGGMSVDLHNGTGANYSQLLQEVLSVECTAYVHCHCSLIAATWSCAKQLIEGTRCTWPSREIKHAHLSAAQGQGQKSANSPAG